MNDFKRLMDLSREISFILRHDPSAYNLVLDNEGWVDLETLVLALRKNQLWNDIQTDDVFLMLRQSSKKRHEIKNGNIRAYYGHSIKQKIEKKESIPPAVLYHGTTEESYKLIQVKGLLPMKRQYVHLSESVDLAQTVALRRTKTPIILQIDTGIALEDGTKFFKEENGIWLSDTIEKGAILKAH